MTNYQSAVRRFLVGVVCLFVFTTAMNSQTNPPAEPDDFPVVVSRDDQDEPQATVRTPATKSDVRESATRTPNTIVLPSEIDTSVPRTAASPYNISLTDSQQKMMLFLDILSKTEARAESLRGRLFEMLEKENTLKSQIAAAEWGLRPEQIQNSAALIGSLRPEEVRRERARVLEAEKSNLDLLLREVVRNRGNLEAAVLQADRLVERVRSKFEEFVDNALEDGLDG